MPAERAYEVLVIGAGPAGIAAACCASESGAHVGMLDDNPAPGGQIWRGESARPKNPEAARWLRRIRETQVTIESGAQVVSQPAPGALSVEAEGRLREIEYKKLIVATGARERFLPFPGWTLPNVMGAGGLQALVKGGLPIAGKKVAIAGTGPLLLAVGEYLHRRGARVELIAEQAPLRRLIPFGAGLLSEPAKALQALKLKWELRGIPYITGCWPVAAQGREKLDAVTLRSAKKTWQLSCDYLACGFGLVPNIELVSVLGCETRNGAVKVDQWQQTTVPGVYAAGEATGIGGLDLSLVEGQIAGYAAAGKTADAEALLRTRGRALRFQQAMERAFSLREELKQLPDAGSLVCRCEDVPFRKLQGHDSWRSAKLQTRCGMGPCQGRICGPAVEFLFGWQFGSVRPPIFPTSFSDAAGRREPGAESA